MLLMQGVGSRRCLGSCARRPARAYASSDLAVSSMLRLTKNTGRRRLTLAPAPAHLLHYSRPSSISSHHHCTPADLALCIVSYMSTAAREAVSAPDGVAFGLDVSRCSGWERRRNLVSLLHDPPTKVGAPRLSLQVCFLLFSAYLVFMMQTGFAMVSEAALQVEVHLFVAHAARLHAVRGPGCPVDGDGGSPVSSLLP